jgi:hypothetical protein
MNAMFRTWRDDGATGASGSGVFEIAGGGVRDIAMGEASRTAERMASRYPRETSQLSRHRDWPSLSDVRPTIRVSASR